jgi:hypothetical protein
MTMDFDLMRIIAALRPRDYQVTLIARDGSTSYVGASTRLRPQFDHDPPRLGRGLSRARRRL